MSQIGVKSNSYGTQIIYVHGTISLGPNFDQYISRKILAILKRRILVLYKAILL